MRAKLTAYLELVITLLIYAVVFLTPLIVSSFTTEFFEIPKLTLLTGVVLVLLGLWSLTWVIKGKVTFTKTPLDIPLILLLVILCLATFFSESRFVSILGNFPRVHGSLISYASYILFYFVVVSNLKTKSQIRGLYYLLLGSTFIVALVTLLSYFHIYLPFTFAPTPAFTPTGSPFSTQALIILMLPFSLLSILQPNHLMPRWLGVFLASIFILVILLTGNPIIWGVGLISILLILFAERGNYERLADEINSGSWKSYMPWLVTLVPIICLIIAFLSFLPLGAFNPLYQYRQDYPQEIQLPLSPSWKVAAGSFRDNPFLGTGPATFLFNYTTYKPLEINSTSLWNIRFDQAFNEYFQTLGTLGLLGFLSLIFISLIILALAWKRLNKKLQSSDSVMAASLSYSVIFIVILLLVHASTIVLMLAAVVILAMFMGLHRNQNAPVEEVSLGIKASSFSNSNIIVGDVLPVIIFIPVLVFIAWALFNGVQLVKADYYHRLALNAASTRGIDTYNNLVLAEKFNPWVDLYRTDLAQTNFALANAIASNKGPSEASPEGSLSDEDKQDIQVLLSQAINEGRAATALSPNSAQNWEILGSIYRQITGVAQNALQFSLDAYGKAIQKDPLNPLLRLNVGGLYYSIKNYDLAIRFFTDVVTLKPDYANGYYNLAIALRDKGDTQNAQAVVEQMIRLIDVKSKDYEVATKLLAELKDKNATTSATSSSLTAPTTGQNSALQKDQLPKVVDLPKDQKLSTPSALTSPKPTPTPSPSSGPEGN